MASAATTSNLGLPQWVGTEKPERTDFNTAFDAIDAELWKYIYPVGCLFETTDSAFNPQTHFGGTWEQYGAGRVTVGYSSGETEFNAAGKTGGAKTHTLTVGQMPKHRHTLLVEVTPGSVGTSSGTGALRAGSSTLGRISSPPSRIDLLETITEQGSNEAHDNLQPYITVFRWRRTA